MAQPAKIKGLLWTIFALTATFSAFVLPAHIFFAGPDWYIPNHSWYVAPYLMLLIFSALYHSLYRFTVFIKDLGYNLQAKVIGTISFLVVTFTTLILILFYILNVSSY
jgi:hypothetical protein